MLPEIRAGMSVSGRLRVRVPLSPSESPLRAHSVAMSLSGALRPAPRFRVPACLRTGSQASVFFSYRDELRRDRRRGPRGRGLDFCTHGRDLLVRELSSFLASLASSVPMPVLTVTNR